MSLPSNFAAFTVVATFDALAAELFASADALGVEVRP